MYHVPCVAALGLLINFLDDFFPSLVELMTSIVRVSYFYLTSFEARFPTCVRR
jgi:hypothetical protein